MAVAAAAKYDQANSPEGRPPLGSLPVPLVPLSPRSPRRRRKANRRRR